MNNKIKYFFLSLLTLLILSSCSNLANDLQKRKEQNLYNIKIQASANGSVTASKTSAIKAGEEIILTVTAIDGYGLKNISVVNALNKDVAVAAVEQGASYKFTMPNSDVTVDAVFRKEIEYEFIPGDGVRYRIEHYQQDVGGGETYELYAIQEKSGEVGTSTEATPKDYIGFIPQTYTQKIIEQDGNTVVRIYYNRKLITYTFDPNGGNWDGSTEVETISGLYDAVIPLEDPKKCGYDLTWDKTKPNKFGAINLDFTASWSPKHNTKYTIEIYEQDLEGGDRYTLIERIYKAGTTDTQTNYEASDRTGFDRLAFSQMNINGDESTVLKVYYNRKLYSIVFNTNGGTSIQSLQVLYGTKIQTLPIPTKNNCRFFNWYTDSSFETPFNKYVPINSSMNLYAYWIDDSITYMFHETVTKLPAGTDGSAGTTGEYVLFGDFPQSLKAKNVEIDETITMNMGSHIVYCGNDGCLYEKYLDYSSYNYYYYKIEPIKWRVLSKSENGVALLLSENILDSYYWIKKDQFEYSKSVISTILDTTLFNWAFTKDAMYLIQNTIMRDESYDAISGKKFYESDYISHKLFLLSKDEVTDVFHLNGSNRARKPTDYADGNIYYNNDTYTGSWWLRTSCHKGNDAAAYAYYVGNIYENFDINYKDVTKECGIVPAVSVYMGIE